MFTRIKNCVGVAKYKIKFEELRQKVAIRNPSIQLFTDIRYRFTVQVKLVTKTLPRERSYTLQANQPLCNIRFKFYLLIRSQR